MASFTLIHRVTNGSHTQSFISGDVAVAPALALGTANDQAGTEVLRVGGTTLVEGDIFGTNDGTGVVVGHTGASANTGSALQLQSYTSTERDNLSASNGMLVYNSTSSTIEGYSGSWQDVLGGGSGGTVTASSFLADFVATDETSPTFDTVDSFNVAEYADSATREAAVVWEVPAHLASGTVEFRALIEMSTANAGNVDLSVEYRTPNGTLQGPTQTVFDPNDSANVAEFTSVLQSISTTSLNAGDLILFKLKRSGTSGSDTHTGTLLVHGIEVQYPVSGSAESGSNTADDDWDTSGVGTNELVYIDGTKSVGQAIADNFLAGTEQVIGVVTGPGVVDYDGRVQIKTEAAAQPTAGTRLFLSNTTAGQATPDAPDTSNHYKVFVGWVADSSSWVSSGDPVLVVRGHEPITQVT